MINWQKEVTQSKDVSLYSAKLNPWQIYLIVNEPTRATEVKIYLNAVEGFKFTETDPSSAVRHLKALLEGIIISANEIKQIPLIEA